jgi:hypothetical protein
VVDRVLAHGDHERVIPRSGRQETKRHRRLAIFRKERVACDLFLHEPGGSTTPSIRTRLGLSRRVPADARGKNITRRGLNRINVRHKKLR